MEPTTTSTSSDFQKYVFHTLECPVCLDIATPPVTLCRRGHFICGICRKKLEICVICRDEYTDLRCYTVEKIASLISVRCRYKPCQITSSITKFEEHLEMCDYRPVVCNRDFKTVCVNKPIEFDKFVDHLKEAHGAISADGLFEVVVPVWIKETIKEPQDKHVSSGNTLYTHDDVSFILNMAIEDAALFLWMTAMLPELQASNYSADIQIVPKDTLDVEKINGDTSNLKWTVGVVSARVTFEDMKGSRDCVTIPATRVVSVSGTKAEEDETFSLHVELRTRKL